MLEILESIAPLAQVGAVGVMLTMTWRLMVRKDKEMLGMVDAMNKERQKLYDAHSDMVAEVTAALVNKNNTDDKMATAITKLADTIKERGNETS
jgi:hypothetical protein